jgi:hypothetical protein
MFLTLLLGAFIGGLSSGGIAMSDCKKLDFKPQACWQSKQIHKAENWLCEVQGKKFVGNAPGNHNGCSK